MAISLGDAVLKLGADTGGLDKGLREAENSVRSAMDKISGHLRVAGAAFTALGAAGLKMSHDAREVNAVLGSTAITLGTTTGEMRNLVLATTDVTFSIQSVTATFDLLTRAGIRNTDELKASAKAFDALADAIGSSAEIVADALIPAYKALGVDIPTTVEEMDKLTWLFKNTMVDVQDFGSAMSYVARYGRELGLSLGDVIAILAALEAQGKGGTTATRMLRTAITQAADGSISLNDALGITNAELETYKEKLGGVTGLTQEHADAMNEQYGIMDRVKQKVEELTLRLGSFLEPLEPIMAALTALGPFMIALSTGMGQAAAKTVAATIATVAHNVAMVASRVALTAAAIAQRAWNAALNANPIVLVVTAVIAAIALLIKYWDEASKAFMTSMHAVWDFFKKVWDGIVGVAKAGINGVIGLLNGMVGAFEWGINFIIRAINSIPSITLPDWLGGWTLGIPEIGEVKLPRIPTLDMGGVVTGPGLFAVGPGVTEVVHPIESGIVNNFNISSLVVREQADVRRIADELYRLQQARSRAGG